MAARAVSVTDEEVFALGEGVLEWARTFMLGSLEVNPASGQPTPPSIEDLIGATAGVAGIVNTPRGAEIVRRHLFSLFEGRLIERQSAEAWAREQLEDLAEGA